MNKSIAGWIGLLLVAFVASVFGQTTRPSPRQGILPAEAYMTDRDSNLEQELRRLKDAEAAMGPNHPKLASVLKRIGELEVELATLRAIPNPLANFAAQGINPRDIVDQISDKELRGLAVRLALDLKDLRKRVEELERRNPPR